MNVTTNVQGPAQVGRMENGDRAVNVQGGMARSTQAGQGQETQLCSAGGKDKTQREGAKKPQLEAAPGSWVGLVGDPETSGPLSPPHHTDGSTLSPSPLICRCWPRWTCPMPGADTPGPLGSPCDCLGAWMVDSAPHGACLGTAQSTEAPEVKELGGGGPVEPPTASTWPQRRIPGPTVGPETHLGLQEGGAEQVQSWDP